MRRKLSSCLMVGLLTTGAGSALAQTATKASDPGTPRSPHPMIDELRAKGLLIPVAGVTAKDLKDTFRDPRAENRVHYAVDIIAARGTPVLSTDSGRVLKLFTSKSGGRTIYAIDPTERYIYYYAHLDRYRPGLKEGDILARGDTIGFVGTSGNAAPNNPHLHFTIMRTFNVKRWSRGTPINPAKVF